MLKFKTLTLDDAKPIASFVNLFLPYSDFNFVSLYSWSLHSQTKFCLTENALYLLLPDYTTQLPIATFLCRADYSQSMEEFLDLLSGRSLPAKFDLLPDVMIDRLQPYLQEKNYGFEAHENRGAHDYILDVEMVTKADGNEYSDFRYKRAKFKREYGESVKEVSFSPTNETDQRHASRLADKWAELKKLKNEIYEDEIYAFRRFLSVAKDISTMRYVALEHDGHLAGLASCEVLPTGYAIGHFLKYNTAYKGIYYTLVHRMCELLAAEGVKLLNIEQDLDIPGLREAKLRLRPVGFLKKYSLTVER